MRLRGGTCTAWAFALLGALSASAQAPTPAPTPAPSPAAAPASGVSPAWKPFQELAFLTGSWVGGATLGSRFGGRVARFGPELSGAFFVAHASTTLAAEEGGRPEETIEEEGWIAYDRDKRKYVATWFLSNGVSAVLDVELLPDGVRLVSRDVVNYEAGTKMRILAQRQANGEVAWSMELAAPGRDFAPWLVTSLKRR